MDARELLDEYEATGDERTHEEATRRHRAALAERPDAAARLHDFGYLQECHGRRAIERPRAATTAVPWPLRTPVSLTPVRPEPPNGTPPGEDKVLRRRLGYGVP
jgi:hypothetical protein